MNGSKIIVAGAGIGGLTAAACLLQAGFDVSVYEQASVLGEVGAGIQMSANAMHVLRHLGLGERIEKVGVRPGAYVFRLFDTAEVIQQFSLAEQDEKFGAPYLQVHRADLHDILVARVRELKPDAIHLNRRVVSYTERADGVALHLHTGEVAEGDLLVGADGLKSAVREQMYGAVPATYTGDAAWRLLIPVERLPPDFLPPVMTVVMGPARHVVMYYVRGGAMLNFVGSVEIDEAAGESWTARFPWEDLKREFEGWHPIVQTVIDAADRDGCYRWSLYTRPPIERWSTDRVTILGDAAHATLPYLAQGAAMSIEDGAVLTRALLRQQDVADAVGLYERNRMERTQKIVQQSYANRTLFHLRTTEQIRAAFSGRNEGASRNAWLYSYNPLTVPLV